MGDVTCSIDEFAEPMVVGPLSTCDRSHLVDHDAGDGRVNRQAGEWPVSWREVAQESSECRDAEHGK